MLNVNVRVWSREQKCEAHLSFTPGLKPTAFTNPTPLSFISSFRTASTDFCLHRFFWATRFFSLFFVSGPCARLSWPSRQLLSARKSTVSYRDVSRQVVPYRSAKAGKLWMCDCRSTGQRASDLSRTNAVVVVTACLRHEWRGLEVTRSSAVNGSICFKNCQFEGDALRDPQPMKADERRSGCARSAVSRKWAAQWHSVQTADAGHRTILIIFGRNVAMTVSSQKVLYFSTSPN